MLLDVGCGDGVHLAEERQRCIGIDITIYDLRAAKERFPEHDFVLGDAHALPFKHQSFDEVICAHLIEHVDDPKRVVNEMWRVLKKEGKLRLEAPNGYGLLEYVNRFFGKIHWSSYVHLYRFSVEDLIHLLQAGNFEVIAVNLVGRLGPVMDSVYFHLCNRFTRHPDRDTQMYAHLKMAEISRWWFRKKVSRNDHWLIKLLPSLSSVVLIRAKRL